MFKQFLKNGNKLIVVSPTVNEDTRRLDPDYEYNLRLIRVMKRLNETTVMEIKDDIKHFFENDSLPSNN